MSSDRTVVEGLSGLASAVRSLNDIVSELACGLANGDDVTKGYAFTVVQTLGDHTRELGGEPQITTDQIADWENER